MIKFNTIAAASFWPGLQNVGTVSGTATITGTLKASPSGGDSNSSNMTGTVIISLPDPSVISVFRVNLPDANGHLSSRWFPLMGTTILTDFTANWKLILYLGSYGGGRVIYFNFVQLASTSTSISQRLDIYGHLYSYPF